MKSALKEKPLKKEKVDQSTVSFRRNNGFFFSLFQAFAGKASILNVLLSGRKMRRGIISNRQYCFKVKNMGFGSVFENFCVFMCF